MDLLIALAVIVSGICFGLFIIEPRSAMSVGLVPHLRKEECNGNMSNLQIRRRGDQVGF
jgi:hypothetical protein